LNKEIEKALKPSAKGKTLYVTLGNEMRADDGVGSLIFRKIKNIPGIEVFNAGLRPEDAYGAAVEIKPQKTVFIDAADFSGYEGEIRLIPIDALSNYALSTHRMPINVVAEMIKEDTCSLMHIIGVQISTLNLNDNISPEIEEAAEIIYKVISCK